MDDMAAKKDLDSKQLEKMGCWLNEGQGRAGKAVLNWTMFAALKRIVWLYLKTEEE